MRGLLYLLLPLALGLSAEPAWGPKTLGVLLIGEGEGMEWTKTVSETRKAFANLYPVEALALSGLMGARELQGAVDRLQAARAQKIVVIPIQLRSETQGLDQLRYMLGLREYPSDAFMGSEHMGSSVVKRVKAKVPLVMTKALDDDPLVAAILTDRARELSREPLKENVVLIGMGAAPDLDSLARKVAREGRFVSGRAVALKPEPSRLQRDRGGQNAWKRDLSAHEDLSGGARKGSDQDLREIVMTAGRGGRVLIVPYLLAPDGTERAIRRKLDGLFFQWKGKCLLYDDRILQWIKARAAEGARTPGMVQFKDAGKAPPPSGRKKS